MKFGDIAVKQIQIINGIVTGILIQIGQFAMFKRGKDKRQCQLQNSFPYFQKHMLLVHIGNAVSGNRCESGCRSRGSRVRSRPGPILSWRLIMK